MKKLTLLSLLLTANMAWAALPPTAESLRRIKAITESNAVYEKLGSANWIDAIKESSEEHYTLQTDKCTLSVQVKPIIKPSEPPMVGPEPLEVIIKEMTCKENL